MKSSKASFNPQTSFKTKDFVITILISFICCLIAGYIFFGGNIYEFDSWQFFVITYGFSGAIILALLKYRSIRDTIFISILLLLLQIVLITQSRTFLWFTRDILFFAALYFGIYFYFTWLLKIFQGNKYLRALGLAFLLAISNLLFGLLQILIVAYSTSNEFTNIPAVAFVYIKTGTVVGLGLGVGFDLSEMIIKKYKKVVREGKQKKVRSRK